VVAEVAELAGRSLAPCVLLAGEVYVGAREMRAMGIEAAYPIRPDVPGGQPDGPAPGESELAAAATRVARTWRW
jgi:glycerate kinase